MMGMTLWTLGLAATVLTGTLPAPKRPAERPPFPQGVGVNIHFTKPMPGEIELLKRMGCEVVRMDFAWSTIETTKGKYDFRHYESLVNDLERANIRPYFILDYGNAYYQKGGLTDPAAQDAFARFAGAAVKHFRGKGIIWEVWNEPNILPFWAPKPDVDAYVQLAKKTVKEIRKADPSAWVVGPATSGFDWEFLEAVFAAGLLEDFDAISVHPYRPGSPETVWEDYAKLDSMMEFFGRRRPILSGEWGYSTFNRGVSEQRQASFLMRMWALNAAAKVPISIFYDWRDDGPNPEENEHRFGVVRQNFEPKPSYFAAQKWSEILREWTVSRRLEDRGDVVSILLKSKSGKKLARLNWNLSADELPVVQSQTPSEAETLRKVLGDELERSDIRISEMDAAVRGLKPFQSTYLPRVQGSYGPVPRSLMTGEDSAWTLLNRSRLNVTLVKADGSRSAMPSQSIEVVTDKSSPKIEVPGSDRTIAFGNAGDWATAVLENRPWTAIQYVQNVPQAPIKVEIKSGKDFNREVEWTYRFEKGWQYAGIDPAEVSIPSRAKAALIWVRTDGSGNFLRSRFMDSGGRVFQVNLGTLGDPGGAARWMPVRIPLDGSEVGAAWGGDAQSSLPKGPLKWANLLLVDSASQSDPRSGTLRIGSITYQF